MTRISGLMLGLLALLSVGSPAAQAAYPEKPIRWVIPLAPGGGAELVGNIVTKKLTEALKQPVVVEFRPGGAGVVGSELIVRAAPDGYSLLQGQLAWISIYPALNVKPAYDPLRDLAPISRLVFVTQVLLVHPSLPVRSLKELVALAIHVALGKPWAPLAFAAVAFALVIIVETWSGRAVDRRSA